VTPWFLTYNEVIEIHVDQITRYGGTQGIRNEELLRSALAQPETTFGGDHLHPTIEAQAGAYLFHLVKDHPFIDGNKRVGAACCLVFLDLNGFDLGPELDDIDDSTGKTPLEEIVVAIASGEMNKETLISILKEHIKRV
jgi:death-on-curing protein